MISFNVYRIAICSRVNTYTRDKNRAEPPFLKWHIPYPHPRMSTPDLVTLSELQSIAAVHISYDVINTACRSNSGDSFANF